MGKRERENSEAELLRELQIAGWDKPAIKAYQKYLKKELKGLYGTGRLNKVKKIHQTTYLVGSKIYEVMFVATKVDKVALVLKQMQGTIDEHGFLQLSGRYQFNPSMPPHDLFLKKFSQSVRKKYPGITLSEAGELGRRIHLFRSYLDKHNIDYIRSHFAGETDSEKLLAYATKYKIELDYTTGASLHNRTVGPFTYTKNMKVLAPKRVKDGGGRMSEFIIELETGNFVSQWNVYHIREDGSVESDKSKYRIEECGEIANTESFNYGPSKGKNKDLPVKDNKSHYRLDVKRPADGELRKSVTKKWQSPIDFNKRDAQGNKGCYADIIKKGEVDYVAWREVPQTEKQQTYDQFVNYCQSIGDNMGFNDFWQSVKRH